MYVASKKRAALSQRAIERREREASAPRLSDCCPALSTLRIQVQDHYGLGVTKYVRHIPVERAPAYFVIACGDGACDSAGHDITHEVLFALRKGALEFSSEHACDGSIGKGVCTRTIHFTLNAEYARHT
jgi:hypothetical protein